MKYQKWIIVGACAVLWIGATVGAGFVATQMLKSEFPEVGTLLEEVMRSRPKSADGDTDAISYISDRALGLVLPVLSDTIFDQAKSKNAGRAIVLTSDGWTLMPKETISRFGMKLHIASRSAISNSLAKYVPDAETEFAFVKFDAEGLKVVSFNHDDRKMGERVFVQTEDGIYARRIAVLDWRENEKPYESSESLERMWKLDLPTDDAKGAAVLSSDGTLIGVMVGDDVARPISHFTSALESVLKEGRAKRLSLGVRATNPLRVETVNEGIVDGLIVRGVTAGSPAAKAGLKINDVILRIGSEPALTRPLSEFVSRMKSGDTLVILVRRFNADTNTQTEETISATLK